MEDFITRWGYWAVFLGSLVEGESIILTASFMASMGILSLRKIMLMAFTGTLIADQALYWVGKWYGESILVFLQGRFPSLRPYVQKAMGFLEKYKTAFILSFRFIYGIRIMSPVIIGSHRNISSQRFASLNVVAALLWTVGSLIGFLLEKLEVNPAYSYGFWIKVVGWGVGGIFLALFISRLAIYRYHKKMGKYL